MVPPFVAGIRDRDPHASLAGRIEEGFAVATAIAQSTPLIWRSPNHLHVSTVRRLILASEVGLRGVADIYLGQLGKFCRAVKGLPKPSARRPDSVRQMAFAASQ